MSERDQPLPIQMIGLRRVKDLRAVLPPSFTDGFGGGEIGVRKALRVLGQLASLAHTTNVAQNFPGSRRARTGTRLSERDFATFVTSNLEGNSRSLELITPDENARIISLCLQAGIIERREPNPGDRFDHPEDVYQLPELTGLALRRIFKP